ncbi:nucleotidyltransferase domain-containing protein [Gordonia sp. NPDC003585]|uniref:nucleotidyltransferase domain-containing protein n=1 Tax=unclassified Gordonia (in: high G+C Gram-positive bacteria) TaxID=2657482 RepID=UPI0033BF2F26
MQLNKPLATVTPTLDGDVLAVLASADATFTISQVHRILTTASAEGIRKVLNRLTIQGVVLHDQVGRTNTYRLNTEHLAAEPIMALARLNSAFLNRLEEHLREWGTTLRYAAVFGSAATGHMRLDSDIDLILVRACDWGHEGDDVWGHRVTKVARLITAWTGNDGRIVEYAADEFRAAAAAGEPLLRDVAKQGLTVAGTRSWFNAQLRPASGRS